MGSSSNAESSSLEEVSEVFRRRRRRRGGEGRLYTEVFAVRVLRRRRLETLSVGLWDAPLSLLFSNISSSFYSSFRFSIIFSALRVLGR